MRKHERKRGRRLHSRFALHAHCQARWAIACNGLCSVNVMKKRGGSNVLVFYKPSDLVRQSTLAVGNQLHRYTSL